MSNGTHDKWLRSRRCDLGVLTSKVVLTNGTTYDTRIPGTIKNHNHDNNRLSKVSGSLLSSWAVEESPCVPAVPPSSVARHVVPPSLVAEAAAPVYFAATGMMASYAMASPSVRCEGIFAAAVFGTASDVAAAHSSF